MCPRDGDGGGFAKPEQTTWLFHSREGASHPYRTRVYTTLTAQAAEGRLKANRIGVAPATSIEHSAPAIRMNEPDKSKADLAGYPHRSSFRPVLFPSGKTYDAEDSKMHRIESLGLPQL